MITFSFNTLLLLILLGLVFMPQGAWAFGAGNIPSLSTVEGVNFRHGDIEDTLATLVMASGSFFSRLTGGKKFDGLAIKQVYFGNWLRDYSQAIDVGTLSKNISPELIRIILWVMAFSEFGYGTVEFEVTSERLGVYRAEEHIDNPKGYAEGIDARNYDPRLRGPVDPNELNIDLSTGMKNYICNERGNWPTSSEYVRTSLLKCIQQGRLARDGGSELNQFEAFRLLGQALHTLEDFSAHSNYCELILISMGYSDVFPHVGSNCMIQLNGRRVYPIVTGTFGGQDFIHSLMGGAQDSLSQMEIGDVQTSLENGANDSEAGENLKKYFAMLPIDFSSGGGDEPTSESSSNLSDEMDRLKHSSGETSKDPEEIIAKIYPILAFRDRILKKVDAFFEKVPLIADVKQGISDSLTLFVMGAIQPIISPIINDIVDGLHSGTEMVVNGDEQFRVWNDPNYDNPTHSQLSKDHFAAYLNEPAGKIAKEVVAHVVPLVVKAWEDPDMDAREVTNEALEVFHHPVLASTTLQGKMRQTMEEWVNSLEDRDTIIRGLSAAGVRNGEHLKTGGQPSGGVAEHTHTDSCGHNFGFNIPKQGSNFNNDAMARFSQLNLRDQNEESNYRGQNEYSSEYREDRRGGNESYYNSGFGGDQENYGHRNREMEEGQGYTRREMGGQGQGFGYGAGSYDDDPSYGRRSGEEEEDDEHHSKKDSSSESERSHNEEHEEDEKSSSDSESGRSHDEEHEEDEKSSSSSDSEESEEEESHEYESNEDEREEDNYEDNYEEDNYEEE